MGLPCASSLAPLAQMAQNTLVPYRPPFAGNLLRVTDKDLTVDDAAQQETAHAPSAGCDSAEYDAVIVGGGPRGLATVLRLAARAATGTHPTPRVALVDRIDIGAGATWRTDQPAAYLNNTIAAETTIHPDETTAMSGPPAPGPTLVDWCRQILAENRTDLPGWALEEAAEVQPGVFPTRRLQGVYFRDQLGAAIASGSVEVAEYPATAVDLDYEGEYRHIRLDNGRSLRTPTVVLAQGMVQADPDAETTRLTAAAAEYGLIYTPPGMPAERSFTDHAPGQAVLVRGLGANFFDIAGQLAAHWAGTFQPVDGDPHGRLRYLPSGAEAQLVVSSGRGVPYRSKPDGAAGPGRYTARYATPEWFAEQKVRTGLDFTTDIWPVVAKDLAHAYLTALTAQSAEAVAGDWLQDLDAVTGVEDLDQLLSELGAGFTIEQLTHPVGRQPVDAETWQQFIQHWIDEELTSMSEPGTSPRAAVNNAMSALRGQIGGLRKALTGESMTRDLYGWFERVHLSLASGPPSHRVREVYALAEAGFIDFLGPGMRIEINEEKRCFTARSAQTGRSVEAEVLLEARMTKGDMRWTSDPLLKELLSTGRARIHTVEGAQTTSIEASGAEIGEDQDHGHNLVDAEGKIDPAVVLLGIPANSTQPGSAIGATPGKPSPLLAGADIAAKQILKRSIR